MASASPFFIKFFGNPRTFFSKKVLGGVWGGAPMSILGGFGRSPNILINNALPHLREGELVYHFLSFAMESQYA